MAWQDKTLEAKYTSPGGAEFIFLYEKVSRETELKTGIFVFPDRDGAHVQHQGRGVMAFPMECIFSGPDCMDQADAFEAGLYERGVGELQHPAYGIYKVTPTGKVKRNDDLVTALNESHVTVTFTETITDDPPTELEAVAAAELEEQYDEFTESAAADFAEGLAVETVAEALELQSVLEIQAQAIDDNLTGLVSVDAEALANFKTSSFDLRKAISDLKNAYSKGANTIKKAQRMAMTIENAALNAARLTLNMLKLPSRMAVNLMEKIKGYSQLATVLINQFRNDPFGINNIKNTYESMMLVLTGCGASLATGSALSVAEAAASNRSGSASSASRSMATGGAADFADSDTGDEDGEGTGGGVTGGAVATVDGGGVMSREEVIKVMAQLVSMLEVIKSFQDSKIKSAGEPDDLETIAYTSISGDTTYKLAIATDGQGEVHQGDSFTLTVTAAAGPAKTSTGSVASAGGGTLSLQPSSGAAPFTATIGGAGMTGMAGTISFDDGSTAVAPTILTPQAGGGAGSNPGDIIDSNSNTYLLLNELIYSSIQLIQTASFSLPMQRTIRLDRDRQVIELCCELYGSVDYLDRFIIENDFSIDEIELVPMGREVTYYVQIT